MPRTRTFASVVIFTACSITLSLAVSSPAYQRSSTPWIDPGEGLVLMWASVVNSNGNSMPGMLRSDFHVWEDDREQRIEYFGPNSEPISVGIIRGGGENTDTAITFLRTTSWTEEYFEVRTEVHNGVRSVKVDPSFSTEFRNLSRMRIDCPVAAECRRYRIRMDQIFIALEYLREAANRRKVVLLFGESDDPDPISDPRYGKLPFDLDPMYVMNRALRQDAQIYTVETLPAFFDDISNEKAKTTYDPKYSSNYFEAISRGTGGRVLGAYANSATSMEKASAQIARGLETQYLIGYRSTNPVMDGKWRRIRIAVEPVTGAGPLTAWTRSGYYADKRATLKVPTEN
jgi:Ca-activated chloride channel family protein